MAKAVLQRDVIDIHTGGEDNIFPHHECEIAQSCGASGEDHFARFWMHSRHLMVEGAKMSKSKGNFYTVRQVLDGVLTPNPVDPAVLRYEMIKASYRGQMNFSARGLEDSAANVRRLRDFYGKQAGEAVARGCRSSGAEGVRHGAGRRFERGRRVGGGVCVRERGRVRHPRGDPRRDGAVRPRAGRVGTRGRASGGQNDDWAVERCAALDAARSAKDWATSDAVRDELQDAGYEVKNTPEGTVATKKLA